MYKQAESTEESQCNESRRIQGGILNAVAYSRLTKGYYDHDAEDECSTAKDHVAGSEDFIPLSLLYSDVSSETPSISSQSSRTVASGDSKDVLNKHSQDKPASSIDEPAEKLEDSGDCNDAGDQGRYVLIKGNELLHSISQVRQPEICHLEEKASNPPYTCEFCQKQFQVRGRLKTHIQQHTGERQYACDVCPFRSVTRFVLVNHMRRHTGEKPYTCQYCRRGFAQNSALIGHRRKHTGERPYVCEICRRAFNQSSSLTSHRRTHTGEKPYSCDVCQATFVRRSNLRQHKLSHTIDAFHSCDVCNAAFYCHRSLTKHRKIVHVKSSVSVE